MAAAAEVAPAAASDAAAGAAGRRGRLRAEGRRRRRERVVGDPAAFRHCDQVEVSDVRVTQPKFYSI